RLAQRVQAGVLPVADPARAEMQHGARGRGRLELAEQLWWLLPRRQLLALVEVAERQLDGQRVANHVPGEATAQDQRRSRATEAIRGRQLRDLPAHRHEH